MSDKEKEFLLDWLYQECGRAENELLEKFYLLERYKKDVFLDDVIRYFYRYRYYMNFMRDLIEVLKMSTFDDTTKYKNRSAEFLNGLSLTNQQDDMIYSFVLGILHHERFSDF